MFRSGICSNYCNIYDKLKEDPEYTCCSYQKLLLKKVLTSFNFTTEKFKSSTWEQLKNYLHERDPEVSTQELYICKDCRPVLNADNIPAQSVLNGLYTEPVPEEWDNSLSSLFCFQAFKQ